MFSHYEGKHLTDSFWTTALCRSSFYNHRPATFSRKVVLPSLSSPFSSSQRGSAASRTHSSFAIGCSCISLTHMLQKQITGEQCTERKCKIRKLKFQSIITSSPNAQKKKYHYGKVWHPEGKSSGSSRHWNSFREQQSSLLLVDACLASKVSHRSTGTFRLVGHYILAIFLCMCLPKIIALYF